MRKKIEILLMFISILIFAGCFNEKHNNIKLDEQKNVTSVPNYVIPIPPEGERAYINGKIISEINGTAIPDVSIYAEIDGDYTTPVNSSDEELTKGDFEVIVPQNTSNIKLHITKTGFNIKIIENITSNIDGTPLSMGDIELFPVPDITSTYIEGYVYSDVSKTVPVEGAIVVSYFLPVTAEDVPVIYNIAGTDQNGYYRLESMMSGSYDLYAGKLNYFTQNPENLTIDQDDIDSLDPDTLIYTKDFIINNSLPDIFSVSPEVPMNNISFPVTEPLHFSINASDSDNNVLNYKWTTSNISSGFLEFTNSKDAYWITNKPVENMEVKVKVSDNNGGEITQTWTFDTTADPYAVNWNSYSNTNQTGRVFNSVTKNGNNLWIIGGFDFSHNYQEDILASSDNGMTWNVITGNNNVTRSYHTCEYLDNRLWIIGGKDSSNNIMSDIYTSSDNGVTWNLFTVAGDGIGAGNRQGHSSTVINNKLVIVGGRNASNEHTNDVFVYDIATSTWSKYTGEFSPRSFFSLVNVNGTLYITGGETTVDSQYTLANDTWKSTDDGMTWTKIEPYTYFNYSPRAYHASAEYNGKLYIFGGIDTSTNTTFNDVFYLQEDKIWIKENNDDLYINPRSLFQTVSSGTEILMIGGNEDNTTFHSDIIRGE